MHKRIKWKHFEMELKSSKRYISIGKETSKSSIQKDFHYI